MHFKIKSLITIIFVMFLSQIYPSQLPITLEALSPCQKYKISLLLETDTIYVWDTLSEALLAKSDDEIFPGATQIWYSKNTNDPNSFFIILSDHETEYAVEDWVRIVVLKFDQKTFKLSVFAKIKSLPSYEKILRLTVCNGNFLECSTSSGTLYRISLIDTNIFQIFDDRTKLPIQIPVKSCHSLIRPTQYPH